MSISDIPFADIYLEHLPLNKIAKYPDGPPKNGVPFTGYPQQHPTEKNKILLVHDPLGEALIIMEFKLDDVIYLEEIPQMVTEKGEGVPLVKLWIRRGTHGMLLVPFEVNESLNIQELHQKQKGRFTNPPSGKTDGFSTAGSVRL